MGERTIFRIPEDKHILLLVFSAGLGAQFIGWNESLKADFWTAFVTLIVLMAGYLVLALCTAEMTSTLPFAGGNFGFARVSLGPYLGYLVGWVEIIQNTFLVATCIQQIAFMLTDVFSTRPRLEYAYYAVILVLVMAVHHRQPDLHTVAYCFTAIVTLLLLVFYLGAMVHGDFSRADSGPAPYDHPYADGLFVHYTSWYFIILNIIPIISGYSSKPKAVVPIVVLSSAALLAGTAFTMLASAASLSDTLALSQLTAPLSPAYHLLFGIPMHIAPVFSILPVCCLLYLFVMALTKQMTSMANSGLLPKAFKTDSAYHTHYLHGTITVALFAILVVLRAVALGWPGCLFNTSSVCHYLNNILMFVSYIVFRRKYNGLEKPFENPFGAKIALFGMAVFLVAELSVVGYLKRIIRTIIMSGIIFGVVTLYYVFSARKSQCFSDEEQKVLFVAYVINANTRSRLQRTKSRMNLHSHDESSIRSGGSFTPVGTLRRFGEFGSLARGPSLHGISLSRSTSGLGSHGRYTVSTSNRDSNHTANSLSSSVAPSPTDNFPATPEDDQRLSGTRQRRFRRMSRESTRSDKVATIPEQSSSDLSTSNLDSQISDVKQVSNVSFSVQALDTIYPVGSASSKESVLPSNNSPTQRIYQEQELTGEQLADMLCALDGQTQVRQDAKEPEAQPSPVGSAERQRSVILLERRKSDRMFRRSLGDVIGPGSRSDDAGPSEGAAISIDDNEPRPHRGWLTGNDEQDLQASPASKKRRPSGWMRSSFNALTTNIARVVPMLEDRDFEQYTEAFVQSLMNTDLTLDEIGDAPTQTAGRDSPMVSPLSHTQHFDSLPV